jgi:hypothetical protein
MKRLLVPALVLALMGATPSSAQELPNATLQEVLVKTSLLTLSDAITTGNYTVLHAKVSKPFRDQVAPERLRQAFKSFENQKIGFGLISTMAPIATNASRIANGQLLMRGYFDTKPSRLTYELDFIVSEGEWKLVNININAKPPAP